MNAEDLLGQLERVRGRDGHWTARCPAHVDGTPSLGIDVADDGRLLVFCQGGCDTADVMAAAGFRMRDLMGDIDPNELRPAPVRQKRLPPAIEDAVALSVMVRDAAARLHGPGVQDHAAVKYAAGRFGVTVEDIHRLDLGYTTAMPGGPRLVVPFKDQLGMVAAMQARALQPEAKVRWMSPKNPTVGKWSRLGWFPGLRSTAPVAVTEGPGDALTAVAAGFNAIAIRGASNGRDEPTQAQVIEMVADRHVVLCGDGDKSGDGFNAQLLSSLRRAHCDVRVLTLPAGRDLTDLRGAGGDRFAAWFRDRMVA